VRVQHGFMNTALHAYLYVDILASR